MGKHVITQKEIVCFLPLAVQKGVVIVSFEAFDHITRMTAPLIDLAVRLHCVYKMRTSILNSDGVTVIVKP